MVKVFTYFSDGGESAPGEGVVQQASLRAGSMRDARGDDGEANEKQRRPAEGTVGGRAAALQGLHKIGGGKGRNGVTRPHSKRISSSGAAPRQPPCCAARTCATNSSCSWEARGSPECCSSSPRPRPRSDDA